MRPLLTTKYRFIDLLLSRTWPQEAISQIIGDYSGCHFGYSSDENIRKNAASGGMTTTILSYLLDHNLVDAVLVAEVDIEDNTIGIRYKVVTQSEDLLGAQGSIYIKGDFFGEAMSLIRNTPGKLAIVCLPCQATYLRKVMAKDPDLKDRISWIITLFCGHNSEPDLVQHTVEKIRRKRPGDIRAFSFRKGRWRGMMSISFSDGTTTFKPCSAYKLYQNLFFFSEKKCLACVDHFGYEGDICVGDVWLFRMKAEQIKHNAVIAKHDRARQLIADMEAAGKIVVKPQPVEQILECQSRTARRHSNSGSKSRIGKFFKLSLPDLPSHQVQCDRSRYLVFIHTKLED